MKLGMENKLSEKPDLISLKSNLITSQFIDICHNNNILTLSWDFLNYKNALDKIKSLVNMGIDGILFDNYKNIPIIKQWVERD
jgi:predicted TIM-barrel enzyme